MRWVLVEAADRILPEVSPAMADYTAALLRRRHIEVRLGDPAGLGRRRPDTVR
jgi:NADH:ubiquinone reductase (H+-translocating)